MSTHDASWVLMMHHEHSWCIMSIHDPSWVLMMHHEYSWCIVRSVNVPWLSVNVTRLSANVFYCPLLSAIVLYCPLLSAIVRYCPLIVSYCPLIVRYCQLMSFDCPLMSFNRPLMGLLGTAARLSDLLLNIGPRSRFMFFCFVPSFGVVVVVFRFLVFVRRWSKMTTSEDWQAFWW